MGRCRRLFAEDAGPPCGHPASNGSVLDGTSPASGRQAVTHALSRRARRALQLFRLRHASPVEPSGASGRLKKERVSAPLPFAHLAPAGCTSMRPAFARSSRLPSGKSRSSALASTRLELCDPLADGRSCCTYSSMFENFD
jgi:hypothetical protein